jgi:foldase protein PrsA
MKTMRFLAALGAVFVVAVAVSACGASSTVPAADVAMVAGNPISLRAFNHWMYVAEKGNAAQSGGPVIVPTDPPSFSGCIAQVRAQIAAYAKTPAATIRSDCKLLFTQLSSQVMDFLIKAYWYQGTAYKDGLRYTAADAAKAYKTAKAQTFPTSAQYKAFLAETGETPQDITFRLRVNTLFQRLINRQVPAITPARIKQYYESHQNQFGTPESRNVKLIQTGSQSAIDAALAALKSGRSWASVAKQYSTNSASKATGGVITGLQSGQEEAAVNKVIFSAPLNKLEGPIKGTFGYYLVEVTKVTPAVTQPLSKVTAEIKTLLKQQYDATAQTKIDKTVKAQWGPSTYCAPAYSMADCHGYTPPKTTTAPSQAGSTVTTHAGSTSPAGSTVTVNPKTGSTTASHTKKK